MNKIRVKDRASGLQSPGGAVFRASAFSQKYWYLRMGRSPAFRRTQQGSCNFCGTACNFRKTIVL